MIVIKKITVAGGGAHGGSWKVAFADFMTAMMAFFLVMWLLGQSEDVKKNVSDYFSTPSVIEYNFANFGVELTLEKIFLDLINEPLKFLQTFLKPADFTPNFMRMGSKNIVIQQIAERLGKNAQNVRVNGDEIYFEIPANQLFKPGTADTLPGFAQVLADIKGITSGLEDSNIFVDSVVYDQNVSGKGLKVRAVAQQRLDYVTQNIESGLEHPSVDLYGKVERPKVQRTKGPQVDLIRLRIKQKEDTLKDRKPRKLQSIFGEEDADMDVYQNFVKGLTE